MALEYFLYRTDYNNTLVERSNTSFAPLSAYTGQILIDYFIPTTQPLFYYRESGSTIVLNSEANISEYLQAIAQPPSPEDSVAQYQFTGYTETIAPNTFLKLDQSVPQIVSGGTPQFDSISLNINSGQTHTHQAGKMHWNHEDGTLEVDMLNNDVSLQVGQESYIKVKNTTGGVILSGKLVYPIGAEDGLPLIELAEAAQTRKQIGMTTHDIPDGGTGYVTVFGKVRGLNTSGYTAGNQMYVSIIAGEMTDVPPPAPYYVISLGILLVADAVEGEIILDTKPSYTLEELSNVHRSGATTIGEFPVWNGLYYDLETNINDYLLKSAFSGYTGTTTLQNITEVGATTDVESTFSSGLITNKIKSTGATTTGIQITKADGTPIINIDTISGFTGFGTIDPKSTIHLYGTDTDDESLLGIQTNGIDIDGVGGADKEIRWGENGNVQWIAGTYRDELAKFWYLYNQEGDVSPLVISDTGRVGINTPSNIINKYGLPNINGGLDDIRFSGLYDKNFVSIFEIEIDGVGTPDTFRWRVSYDEGDSFTAWVSGIPVSSGETLMESGVYVYFLSETGHTIGNTWEKPAFPQLPQGTFTIHPNNFDAIVLTNDYGQETIEYIDYTGEFNSSRPIDGFPLFTSGNTLGAFYVGSTTKLNSVFFNINSGGNGILLVTEYWNGTNWVDISVENVGFLDNTQNFTQSGGIFWANDDLLSWIRADIQDFEADDELYWIRFRSASNVTKQPILNNIGRNGRERISVYSSPYDYKSSFYVDLLGRTNVGGGTITRKNKLQITTVDFLDVAVGSASLVEMDSDDAEAADLRIKLTSNDTCGTGIAIVKTRGELTAAHGVQTGDELGHIWFRSRVATTGVTNNSIVSEYTGTGLLGSYNGDLIFNTATDSNPTEKVRITAIGNTGFGTMPTAVIHLKSGTTTNAPLKFTSGSLLTTPEAGAVEFLGDKYYGTTTGDTRKTFAFLESPEFLGTPELPITTELNGVNLDDYILNSGGTDNPLLTLKSDFDNFTGSTVSWDNIDFSGSTLADIEIRNAEDISVNVPHWDSYNVDDFTEKIADYVEDTQGSGRLSPENVLSGRLTNTIIVSGGTGYITYSNFHKYITWSAQTFNVSGYAEGTYYVYVDTNGDILIDTTNPDGIHNIRLGYFYWGDTIIGVIQQCGCILLNSLSRTVNFMLRQGYFIYDGGGNVNVMSGDTRKIVSSPCKVQFGLMDSQISEISSNDASTFKFMNYYNSADKQWESNYYFSLIEEGRIPVDTWNDVTKNSTTELIGYDINFINNSNVVTSTDDLTSFDLVNTLIYLSADSKVYMTRVSGVTWTGSQTNIYLSAPYQGAGGSGTLVVNYALPIMPVGKYAKHLIIRSSDDIMLIIYAQRYYDDINDAILGVLPELPSGLSGVAIKMAYIITTSGQTDLTGHIYDIRPLPFSLREGGQSGGGTTITNHGNLSGLDADDHLQYLRTDGTRTLNGIQQYQSQPTFTNNLDIVNKKYVDDADNLKLNSTIFNTYSGTTVPNTYLSINNFNMYSGTTVPNTYYNKSEINSYTGATATLIGTKQDTITGAATTITANNLTINRALISNGSGKVAVSTVTSTQLGYVAGVTSAIQTQLNTKAPLASPALTGVPTAPTAAVDTSTTQIATTAFVIGQAANANPTMNGTVAIGTSLRYARQDHVHPIDTSRFAVAGGTITGSVIINNNLNVSGTTTENTLRINSGLAKYNGDYRNTFDNRTLVDREFVEKSIPLTVLNATSAGATTTTSTTDVLQTGMQILNVPAGTYLLSYGTWVGHGSANAQIYTEIYVGGAPVTGSEMMWSRGGNQGDTNGLVTYNNYVITLGATATVQIRWRTNTGTATSNNRYLTLLKTSSLV